MGQSKNQRTKRIPGKVDFEALGVTRTYIGWYELRNKKTRKTIKIYAFRSPVRSGPWSGYDDELLPLAPCAHCGKTGHSGKHHVCPGHFALPDSNGEYVPCGYEGLANDQGEHVCTGRLAMSWHGIKRWTEDEWEEISRP